MIIAFYVVAGLAALAFLAAGLMKLARPLPALKAAGMGWVDDFSAPAVKLIALAEVLGAIGLIAPVATGIAPALAPLAGLGLTVVMLGAAVVHRRRDEPYVAQAGLAVIALTSAALAFIVID